MYLLYEHFKSPSGEHLATDMMMSSWFPGKPGINFKRPADAACFEFCKATFKQVHIKDRTYNPDTNVWSFLGMTGQHVYKILKDSPIVKVGLLCERVEDLQGQSGAKYIKKPEKPFVFDASDFFYTPEAPAPSGPTREQARAKLAALLGMSEEDYLKANPRKLYLRGAMLFHPDRNNGDGAKMTELNYLWQIVEEKK